MGAVQVEFKVEIEEEGKDMWGQCVQKHRKEGSGQCKQMDDKNETILNSVAEKQAKKERKGNGEGKKIRILGQALECVRNQSQEMFKISV